MDEELYSALVGSVPTTQAQQQAVIAALRRKEALGTLGVLSRDKVLMSDGRQTIEDVQRNTQTLGQRRDKATDDAQTKAYQDWQMEYSTRNADRNYALQAAQLAEQARYNRERLALERDKPAAQPKYRQMTAGERDKMAARADSLYQFRNLYEGFKDSYAQPFGPGPLSDMGNAAVSQGMIPIKGKEDAQNWWAQWRNIYTLAARGTLFGATLTANEQQAWKETDINPAMSAAQIRTRISQLYDKMSAETKRRLQMYEQGGFDPGEFGGAFMGVDMSPLVRPPAPTAAGAVQRGTPAPNAAQGLPRAATGARPAAPAGAGVPDLRNVSTEDLARMIQELKNVSN